MLWKCELFGPGTFWHGPHGSLHLLSSCVVSGKGHRLVLNQLYIVNSSPFITSVCMGLEAVFSVCLWGQAGPLRHTHTLPQGVRGVTAELRLSSRSQPRWNRVQKRAFLHRRPSFLRYSTSKSRKACFKFQKNLKTRSEQLLCIDLLSQINQMWIRDVTFTIATISFLPVMPLGWPGRVDRHLGRQGVGRGHTE